MIAIAPFTLQVLQHLGSRAPADFVVHAEPVW
jgi:hypothetical protein